MDNLLMRRVISRIIPVKKTRVKRIIPVKRHPSGNEHPVEDSMLFQALYKYYVHKTEELREEVAKALCDIHANERLSLFNATAADIYMLRIPFRDMRFDAWLRVVRQELGLNHHNGMVKNIKHAFSRAINLTNV